MNIDTFAQQIQEIHWRIAELYRDAETSIQQKEDLILPSAFKELGTASEELQVAAEQLSEQNQTLLAMRSQMEAERQRYQDLFEFLPDACLVTNTEGKIQEANRAATTLLNIEQPSLLGKLLINFIPVEARPVFRSKLNKLQLHQSDWVQEWTITLQRRNGELFDAALTVSPVRDSEGKLTTLRWIVRNITDRQRVIKVLSNQDDDFYQNRPKHTFSKGEIIPLEPQVIWVVYQGLVKLSTTSERADEVLVGLAGPSMPFGSSMTALTTYQATAISENVQLVGLSLSEIAASPHVSQILLPKISDRLRQTEALLAISGKRHVKDRLYYLLQWLKQEFGQPSVRGIRVSVRLTHQDIADACCTTRVTITRLLGNLHKQGKIAFDSKNHICLIEERFQKCS
ncbi:MAG TPA: PAS domain S-box protein [Coleofasciculaceae cyanobacterium]